MLSNRANTFIFLLKLQTDVGGAVMKGGWRAHSALLPTSDAGPVFGHKENNLMGRSAGSG